MDEFCYLGQPFSSNFECQIIAYKYDWYWYKNKPSGAMTTKIQPMKSMESISVFYDKQPLYIPQMIERTKLN